MRQPVAMYREREVRCAFCRTDEYGFPSGKYRVDEAHLGVRFNDGGKFRVYLDRADVTYRTVECVAGYPGWAILYVLNEVGKRIVCSLGKDHCLAEKVVGNVRVERVFRADFQRA